MTTPLPSTADFLIIGGGVVGLTVALELRRRHPQDRIVVIEKERHTGYHASGRNSGVLHAGFYYTADSLKARFTREGNEQLTAWCTERGVPLRRCGKLVVARNPAEHAGLDMLLERGERNGVPLEAITAAEAQEIEPRVRTCKRALFSPTTTSVDPRVVMAELTKELSEKGIALCTDTTWTGRTGRITHTSAGDVDTGYVVNAAGLYADRIARAYGVAEDYRMLPFKGLYLNANDQAGPLRCHVYPVPDLEMPFLGVHFTVAADGHVHIGPTALPALWLEHYGGLSGEDGLLARFDPRELAGVLLRELRLAATDPSFRRLAWREAPKVLRSHLVRHAAELLDGVRVEHFTEWGRPGIRAQLLDITTGQLVMDFCFEADERSLHVLNAVSPAFTCSLPFASHLVDALEQHLAR